AVTLTGEDQGERHGAVEQIGATSLPGSLGRPRDVQDVVEELECQADLAAERLEGADGVGARRGTIGTREGAERHPAGSAVDVASDPADHARALEEPRGLELAALHVPLGRDRKIEGIPALGQLSQGKGYGRPGQELDLPLAPVPSELGEG